MRIDEVLDCRVLKELPRNNAVGIDVGSRQTKGVLLCNDEIHVALIPTGFVMQESADEILDILIDEANISRHDVNAVVTTGYGRIAVTFPDIQSSLVTEISCHGMGAHYLNSDVRTIIDIGGQDSKVIRINKDTGKVEEFAMNDKCAAGTGRFLEKIAEVLGYDVTKIGEIALKAKNPSVISSQCVVFAESEVISNRAKGEDVSDLAAGIDISVARRVKALLGQVGMEPEILFTGGVSNNNGMRAAFEGLLERKFVVPQLDTVYTGALGAAIFAAFKKNVAMQYNSQPANNDLLNFEDYKRVIAENDADYEEHSTGKLLQAATICCYTPLEILDAANVSHRRLMRAGTQQEIMAGETYTQSVFCDITKSLIGGFETKNKEYTAVDHLYTFYACECMRKSSELINQKFVPTTVYNLPRRKGDPDSQKYLIGEVKAFKEELEKNTGKVIEEKRIRESIAKYNRIRRLLREISETRIQDIPPLTGLQFKELIRGYYTLPADIIEEHAERLRDRLRFVTGTGERKVRIMLSGGICASGDDKIVNIIENELGARVVAEDNCTGLKPMYCEVDEEREVYDALADAYLNQPPCYRMTPVKDAIDFSVSLAKKYRVDGVVFYYLKFCAAYSIMVKEYTEALQAIGIPVLVIAGDYSGGDEGQIRTRTEAFIEILKERDTSDGNNFNTGTN